jgi:hypothetical protein
MKSPSTGASSTAGSSGKSLPELATELWELVITYAKQETIDPLKSLGRFVLWGVAGSVVLGIGLVLLLLGVLRVLQDQTGPHLTGSWSWVPYVVDLVLCAVIAGIAVSRVGKGKR